MANKIFDKSELEGLNGVPLQQAAQEIKTRLDQKRGFYHQLRNQYFVVEHWDDLNKKIIEFDRDKFNPWNQQWANHQRSNNPDQIISFFESAVPFFEEMDSYVSDITFNQTSNPEIEALKKEVLKHIENDILSLKADVTSKIDEGINNVLGLKAELGLEKNFGENITSELTAATKYRNRFMTAFIVAILSIPIFLFSTYYFDFFKNLKDIEVYSLRVGFTVSVAFLSYFAFSQYKLYQLICLRYSHLSGFLGGGATFISQLIGTENNDVKRDMNKKLAELFMELEDVFGLVKKNNHPAEISMDKLGKLLEQLTNLTHSK